MSTPFGGRPCRRARAFVLACLLAPTAWAQPAPQPKSLAPVQVIGHYDNAVGTSDAASEGAVTQRLIANRPALRPGELLEFVPGMIVTQHSGDGKANQYFLRGFNLDHGTDFATWVDGMPVNMVSHAHGQGYSDLNFLIPELVRRIDYRKGPYFAREGDFSTAGSARIGLADTLAPNAQLTLGENGFRRALLGGSSALGASGATLLGAVEVQANDGPWLVPENQRKVNALLRASRRSEQGEAALTLMAYDARWTSTDQIPASEAVRLGRYGSLDASDGGRAQRLSVSGSVRRNVEGGEWRASAYAIGSRLKLWSNFTYFLDDPANGDQFEQAERRRVVGGEVSRRWDFDAFGIEHAVNAGLQLRHDRLGPVGLYKTRGRERLAVTSEADVRQQHAGVYADWSARWTPMVRSVVGLRADEARFAVRDVSGAATAGDADDRLVSPKLALVFGPWRKTELFIDAGRGFHSNDARGTTDAAAPVPGLVPGAGAELGLRTQALLPGLQTSLALWRLKLDSELVYIGDAGTTEPTLGSRRRGIEVNNHWVLDDLGLPGWLIDLDVAVSRARLRGAPGGEDRVPGAVNRVVSFGVTYGPEQSPWFGEFQLRHFGPRDLVEDGSQRSRATTLAYLRGGWRPLSNLSLTLDVFNLFDREASDIDYYYESRPTSGGAAVEQRHFHPVEPRSVRLTAAWRF